MPRSGRCPARPAATAMSKPISMGGNGQTRPRPRATDPQRRGSTRSRPAAGHSLLHGPHADGKPQRPGRAGGGHAGPLSAECCACACRAVDGHAERKAAPEVVSRHSPGAARRLTLGADKGHDSAGFISDLRLMCVTPQVAGTPRRNRRPDNPSSGLCHVAETTKEDCGAVRPGHDARHNGADEAARHRKARRPVHHDRPQPGEVAAATGK